MKRLHCLLIIALLTLPLIASSPARASEPEPHDITALTPQGQAWVDSVMHTLTPQERLGQLIIPIVDPADTPQGRQAIAQKVRTHHVGGLLFAGGTMQAQAALTDYARSLAPVPLWIALDGEWGPAMRLRDAIRYPRAMTLACISTAPIHPGGAPLRDSLLYAYGRETARQCLALGIHINFAPVLDINTNPANPVIGNRAWGDDARDVIGSALSYASGLEDGGVMAVGKHLPGHGDTDTDSHKTLPHVAHTAQRLHTVELAPFAEWARVGYGGIMVAHLDVPALTGQPGLPASVSPAVVTDLLRDSLAFRGLAFTDGMAMKGIAATPDAALRALQAGIDVLLDPVPLGRQWQALQDALADGRLPQALVDARCRRVLAAKYNLMIAPTRADVDPNVALGLAGVSAPGLAARVNTPEAQALARELYARALVVLQAPQGAPRHKPLSSAVERTIEVRSNKAEALTQAQTQVRALNGKPYALVFYTSPYALSRYAELIRGAAVVVLAHEDVPAAHDAATALMAGSIGATGRLRVDLPGLYAQGSGIDIPRLGMPQARPEDVGMSSAALSRIDRLAQEAIAHGAVPGCQVLVARDGYIIYNKAFGRLSPTQAHGGPVRTNTLYDLASVTKAAATVPALMAAMARYGLRLDDRLAKYIPQLQGTRLWDATLRDALLHETGLPAWYPFHNHIACSTARQRDDAHPLQVAQNLWIEAAQCDTMLQTIARLPLKQPGVYLYSDLNFILLRHVVERVTGQRFDDYIAHTIYAPLGAADGLLFNPQQHGIPRTRIAPTERDDAFRHQMVHGTVHDETAALAGGVEGNAGLFGSAEELAKVLQMLLDDGRYDGIQVLPADVVRLFTAYDGPRGLAPGVRAATAARASSATPRGKAPAARTGTAQLSHRGLGFDRPNGKEGNQSNVAASCPPSAYGHTGFTGTCFWVDPEARLVYIFLSNRIHPTRQNTTLIRENYRTRIHQAIYDAITR